MEAMTQIENVKLQSESYANRGRAILRNIEKYLSESGEELTDAEKAQLGCTTKRECNRRFSLQDVADLLGVSRSSIHYHIENKKIPDRPKAVDSAGRNIKVGYNLEMLWEIRKILNKLPQVSQMVVMGFLNQKGGVGKSTLTWMLAQYLALRGYRVLLIDTDPQGSLSFLLGYRPLIDVNYWDTIAPYILQDVQGALEDHGDANLVANLRYAIRPTHWPNIDIIPACNDLLELEAQSENIMKTAQNSFYRLTGIEINSSIDLMRVGVEELEGSYDVVLFDGTPSVNTTTMNIFSACDQVVAPVPCGMLDFNSSVEFCSMLAQMLQWYQNNNLTPNIPNLNFALAKFQNNAPAKFMEGLIKRTFNSALLSHFAVASDEIQKLSTSFKSIYEVNATGDSNNPAALKATKLAYDALFNEIHTNLLNPILHRK